LQLILNIPAQKATENAPRKAAVFACYKDGSLLLDARDNLKPARFTLHPADNFPWSEFIEKLLAAWQLCDYSDVPDAFKPVKQIPPFVIEGLPNEPVPQQLKVLASLRSQGYFAPLANPSK
jgi:hypothetical protein